MTQNAKLLMTHAHRVCAECSGACRRMCIVWAGRAGPGKLAQPSRSLQIRMSPSGRTLRRSSATRVLLPLKVLINVPITLGTSVCIAKVQIALNEPT